MARFLVTSALPYVNGVKHLGVFVGSILPADVYARYLRLRGHDIVFVCGTDEHGAPSEIAAMEEGLPIKEYCGKYFEIQRSIYERFNCSFDHFGRTSGEENHKTTQEMFLRMYERGFISEKTLKMPYCKKCNRFLSDRFIEGVCPHCAYEGARGDQCENCGRLLDPAELVAPFCNICKGKDIEFRNTKHLFLEFKKLEGKLKKWITESEHWPQNAKNFALGWLKEGLRGRCISRDLSWGVKIPLRGYEDKVFYVWFDAPIGYISFTKEWAKGQGREGAWMDYWRSNGCKIIHFLGKDNIAFHTVFWPAMLIASEYTTLPYQIKSLEFLNFEGRKLSTSRKWGIFTDEALEWFPVDYWRYYLLSILPETSDADFLWGEFQSKVNEDLANTLGNLVHRCLTFIRNNFNGVLPESSGKEWKEIDTEFRSKLLEHTKKTAELFDSYRMQDALKEAISLARDANKYFNDKAPWKAMKENKRDAETTVYLTANAIYSLSILLEPFIPSTSEKVLSLLGFSRDVHKEKWENAGKLNVEGGQRISEKIEPLFKKIEDEEINKYKALIEERSRK
ncbi:methionine--tRNA ligase [Candidatus Micrarchaeota archaeon]|nr:methionine--tRNA ligase [Candidatus Micrarchaeota archaeon]